MRKPVRVAVIGTGQFGTLHAETLVRLPEAELTALVDTNEAAASELGKRLGVATIASSLDTVIEKDLADAVVIATRADTHLPLAEQAAIAGLAVLL